jgi:hypothetical protein
VDHTREYRGVPSLVLGQLRQGDRVVLKTSNSTYEFWAEFPEQAIGVLRGGTIAAPTRVRLAAENASSLDASAEPLRVGERARVVLLGPLGAPVRGFVTSTIASIVVTSHDSVAA